MKFFYFLATFFVALSVVSCKKDKKGEVDTLPNNETAGLVKIQTMEENGLSLEIFSTSGKLSTGYNEVFYRIKDIAQDKYITNATLIVNPIMHMTTMTHSCPTLIIQKITDRPNMYKGAIIFNMASTPDEYWMLGLSVIYNNATTVIDKRIEVENAAKRNSNSFSASDGKKYMIAMVKPNAPIIGINPISALIFERIDGNTYQIVDNYKLEFDPRMPSMGNHSSPNNVHMTQSQASGIYEGKVSLTMTGYWKINLRLLDNQQNVLKGEEITTINESSSIYFEIEF